MKIKRAVLTYWAKKKGNSGSPNYEDVFNFSGFSNSPGIAVLVDEMPARDQLVFRERDGLWYAEEEGFASFLWHPNDGKNHGGYCGVVYKVKTPDGEVSLAGPWSSNSTAVNSTGFGPCLEASMTDDEQAFERGYTFLARAVTIELLLDSLEVFEGLPRSFEMFIGKAGFNYFPLPIKRSWVGSEPTGRLVELPFPTEVLV